MSVDSVAYLPAGEAAHAWHLADAGESFIIRSQSLKLLRCRSSAPARLILEEELSRFILLIRLRGDRRVSAARPGATRMAGRRSCVNSLWSGTERVRIGERLKATLAGVLELEVLRCKQLEMVDAALEDRGPAAADADDPGPVEESGAPESAANRGSATSRRQQVS